MSYGNCRALIGTLVVFISAGLTACGGGGDGDAGANRSAITVSVPTEPLAITPFNANYIAWEAISFQLDTGWNLAPKIPFATPGYDEKCTGGGTVDIVRTGAEGSVTFQNCNQWGNVYNGTILASGINDTPDQKNLSLVYQDFNLSYNGSRFDESSFSNAYQGDIHLAGSVDAEGVLTEIALGDSFALVGRTGEGNEAGFLWTRFHFSNNYNWPVRGTTNMNFTYASTYLGGQVTVQTVVPFTYREGGDFFPSAGQAVVLGARGSKCRLTVLDNVNLRLEVDADGAHGYEFGLDTNWDTLRVRWGNALQPSPASWD